MAVLCPSGRWRLEMEWFSDLTWQQAFVIVGVAWAIAYLLVRVEW